MKDFLGIVVLPFALVILILMLIILQVKVFWQMWIGKDEDENIEK